MKLTTSQIRSAIGLAVTLRIAIRRLRELSVQERPVSRAAAPVPGKPSQS